MLIPLAMGLLGADGAELPTRLEGEAESRAGTRVLYLAEARQSFRFVDVPAAPVPSLLRGFSAPVKLKGVPLERLKFLAIHDTEPFARWEAGPAGRGPHPARPDRGHPPRRHAGGARSRSRRGDAADPGRRRPRPGLCRRGAEPARAKAFLADQLTVVDVDAIHAAREAARGAIGAALAAEFAGSLRRLADPGPYRIDGASIGRRALRNACLAYLAAADPAKGAALAKAQFDAGRNMTDVLAALAVLADHRLPRAGRGARRVLMPPGRRTIWSSTNGSACRRARRCRQRRSACAS